MNPPSPLPPFVVLAFATGCLVSRALAADVAPPAANVYAQKILVANRPGFSPDAIIDENLVNPWGLALRPPGIGGHFWISNAWSLNTSTYMGDVSGKPLYQDGLKVVPLEGPRMSYEDGIANVTGQVYNAASDFPGQPVEFPVSGPASDLTSGKPVPIGISRGSAKFVFVTTDGTINAWRSGTKESMDTAVIVKDFSDHGPDQIRSLPYIPGFTGVAMSTETKTANRLYVSDFQNKTIRVFDNQWQDITSTVTFERPRGLPEGYGPFNIQCIGNRLYIAYAELDLGSDEPATDLPAPGAGRIVAYDLDGRIVQEFADTDRLNSPWGVAIAPANFGPFGGSLLVGNFGDGTIAAFNLETGAFQDYLRDEAGQPVVLDGLWGIAFGNGVSLGDSDSLYFAAGPNTEQDGIFGRLRYAETPATIDAPKLAAVALGTK